MRKTLVRNCHYAKSPITGAAVYCDLYVIIDSDGRLLWHENLFLASMAVKSALNTVRSSASDLLSFTKMSVHLGGCQSITPYHMTGYLHGELFQNRKCSSTTMLRHIETLKSFFQWLLKKGYLLDLPDFDWSHKHLYKAEQPDKTSYFKTQHSLHSLYLDKKSFEAILGGVRSDNKFFNLRDEIVLKLGYECGLRAHEIHNLDTNEIRKRTNEARDKNAGLWATTRIKLVGKGAKNREIYLPPKLTETISNYIQNYRSKLQTKDGALICNKNGSPLIDPKHASSVFTKACKAAMIVRNQNQGYHRLRKCFGTNLVQEYWNAGRDPWVEVPRRMGHKNLETTKRYIQFEALLNNRSEILSDLRMLDNRFVAIHN